MFIRKLPTAPPATVFNFTDTTRNTGAHTRRSCRPTGHHFHTKQRPLPLQCPDLNHRPESGKSKPSLHSMDSTSDDFSADIWHAVSINCNFVKKKCHTDRLSFAHHFNCITKIYLLTVTGRMHYR